MELIANGRLGTAVKKAHLLAACDNVRRSSDDSIASEAEDHLANVFGSVQYCSITWAGFGT